MRVNFQFLSFQYLYFKIYFRILIFLQKKAQIFQQIVFHILKLTSYYRLLSTLGRKYSKNQLVHVKVEKMKFKMKKVARLPLEKQSIERLDRTGQLRYNHQNRISNIRHWHSDGLVCGWYLHSLYKNP